MSSCYKEMVDRCKRDGGIVYYDHKIPMSDFLRDVDSFAANLAGLGIGKGDVITVYLPTCPQSLVAFYACSKIGAIASFVHPVTPVAELKEYVAKTESKLLLFYDVLVNDERKLITPNVTLVRCSICDYVFWRKPAYYMYVNFGRSRLKTAVKFRNLTQKCDDVQDVGQGNDVVCYMHSGGTSGEPKIVKISNDAFNKSVLTIIAMYHQTFENDNYYLCTLPVFHAYGLCNAVHTGLLAGCNLALVPKFDSKVVNRYFDRYNVTVWAAVPAMISKMLKEGTFDRPHLRKLDVIWCGGDTLDEGLVETADTVIRKHGSRGKVMRGYGLTETCGVCAVNNYDDYAKNSCGKPIGGCSVQIRDDDGNVLPNNTVGEIVLRAYGQMSGYLEGGEDVTSEGWLKTGDVGYLDNDGFLYVVDRKKRAVKIAAVNVFPSEVERCIKRLDFVDNACVVPYRYNGKQFIKAYVTLSKQMPADKAEKLVIEHCKANLIRYSVPRKVEVLDAMPLTKLAKVDYKQLEKM